MTSPRDQQSMASVGGAEGSPPAPHTVLLVDDQPEFLALARELLGDSADLQVVGEATSGPEALRLASTLAPDAVVLDIEMPGLHGFETARRLLTAAPDLAIVLISNTDDPQYAELARAVGAREFLPKRNFSAGVLLQVLDR